MSDLQKHIFRHDPEKEARLAALRQENGWVDTGGQVPGISGPPVRADRPISQRQVLADKARIPPSYRTSRSTSPAHPAASRRWQGQDASMPPPLRPAGGLQSQARFTPDQDTFDDPFGTDIENADATTTMSDIVIDDTSPSWSHHRQSRAKEPSLYSQDGSEYEGSLPPGPDDGHYSESRPVGAFDTNDQVTEEDYSDEESLGHVSNEDQSHYGLGNEPDALHEIMSEERSKAAFTHIRETPDSRQKTIQSLMESPSTKKSMVVRPKGRKVLRSKQPLSAEPRHLVEERSVAHGDSQNAQPVYSEYPPKTNQKEISRGFPQDIVMPRSQQPQVEKMDERPVEQLRQSEQHIAQQGIVVKQPPPVQITENERLPVVNKQLQLHGMKFDAEQSRSFGENDSHRSPQAGTTPQEDPAKPEKYVTDADHVYTGQPATRSKDVRAQITEKPPTLENHALPEAASHETSQQMAETSATSQAKKPEPRKRALELDYTPKELSGMSYKLLNSESFDHNPKLSPGAIPSDITKASLPEKLKYTYNLKDREDSEVHRSVVFASLTIEQYEETGDLIIEQFSSILGRYKDARREKRKTARELEKEIARREEQVRNKTTAVEQDLVRLKRGAEDVVRGRGR